MEEGYLVVDHVRMLLLVPPKYVVVQVVDFVKGKSSIHVVRSHLGRGQNITSQHCWTRGYYVSTVGRDKASSWDDHPEQEAEDQRLHQLNIFGG